MKLSLIPFELDAFFPLNDHIGAIGALGIQDVIAVFLGSDDEMLSTAAFEALVKLDGKTPAKAFPHLANIALKTKKRLEWDPVAERITNDKKANDLLHYEYRDQWKNF